MPKTNRTKYAVLGMLSFQPMSGYDMKKGFDGSIAHFWNENYGHIYPVLKRLEKEELVTKKTEQSEGKPQRHVYSITDRGKTDLHEWLQLPAERPTLRIELLLKLFFGNEVSVENMIRKVEEEKAFCSEYLRTFDQIEKHVMSHNQGQRTAGIPYWLITLRYGQHYYRAVSQWCDDTLQTLEEHRKAGG